MATKEIITITDDIDGTEGASPVVFAYGPDVLTIDLSEPNALKFQAAIMPFVTKARKVGKMPTTMIKGGLRSANTTPDTKSVREWAASKGIVLAARGRIPAQVVADYESATRTIVKATEKPSEAPVEAAIVVPVTEAPKTETKPARVRASRAKARPASK